MQAIQCYSAATVRTAEVCELAADVVLVPCAMAVGVAAVKAAAAAAAVAETLPAAVVASGCGVAAAAAPTAAALPLPPAVGTMRIVPGIMRTHSHASHMFSCG